ncbi:MAG: hypothetical protein WDN75_20365 [Bacteroidota bacterium]
MKKLTLLFLMAISCFAYAQTVSFQDFKISEQEIIYQKVFQQDSITAPLLEAYLKTVPVFKNVVATGDGVTFDIEDLTIDYRKFQFSQVGTPPIMQTGKFSGEASVGVKDGKYRVTFKSIMVTGDIGYKKITQKDNLTNYACKNSGTILSQDWCRPNMLGLLDQALTDKFQYRKVKDDW